MCVTKKSYKESLKALEILLHNFFANVVEIVAGHLFLFY